MTTPFVSHSPRILALCLGFAGFVASGKNPGPEDFDLKFKLPPPPVLSPAEAVKVFKLPAGLVIEPVAAEPLVETPVAVSWDDQARMYVCEMRGYMHDVKAAGEDQPIGRIKRLEDPDGDGIYDKATVFVDGLVMPRAVMALGDGALVGEPPNLRWYRDLDGDGVADTNVVVATDFGRKGGQPEHMANTPLWGLDNWIWCGNYGHRFRFQAGKFITDDAQGRGQWGLTQDDWGRLFFNYNSDFLRADLLSPVFYARNPFLPATAQVALNFRVMADQTTWPAHPTPGVNRGYTEKQLRSDGTLATCTAACGPGVYRGDALPVEYRGDVFLCEPTGNLVKRVKLSESGGVVTARNVYKEQEFLASTDERFRPVNACTGPDGALYIVDMSRGVIQHEAFLTHYLTANIKARNLEAPINLGRIWRIRPAGASPKAVRMPHEADAIASLLAHPNGVLRDTAQRLLVERNETSVTERVRSLVTQATSSVVRAQALWTLEGLHALDAKTVTTALRDTDPQVRVAALRLADREWLPYLLKCVDDPDAAVRVQLAASIATLPGPEVTATLIALLKQGGSPFLASAIVSGLRGREIDFVAAAFVEKETRGDAISASGILPMLAACVMKEHRSANVSRLLELAGAQSAGGTRQLQLLDGMAAKPAGKNPPPAKPVYLEAEPKALAVLKASATGRMKTSLAALDEILLWPGKPGAPPPPVIKPLTPDQQVSFERGRVIYASICAACHQPTGLGLDGLAPPLVDSEWALGPADRPIRIVLCGLSGPISVAGTKWRLEMPPLRQLADEDIAAALTYIRRSWDHGASPVSSGEVTKVRVLVAPRTTPWTADELKKPWPVK